MKKNCFAFALKYEKTFFPTQWKEVYWFNLAPPTLVAQLVGFGSNHVMTHIRLSSVRRASEKKSLREFLLFIRFVW